MSVRLIDAALRDRSTTGTIRLVLFCMADQSSDEGACWPKMSTIAARANVSVRQAQRAIAQLETMGLIRREARYGTTKDGETYQTSNMYTVFPALVVTPGCHPCHPGGVTDDTLNRNMNQDNAETIEQTFFSWFESKGMQVLPNDMILIDQWIKDGVTLDDLDQTLSYFVNTLGRTVRGASSMQGAVKVQQSKRLQKASVEAKAVKVEALYPPVDARPIRRRP